LTCTKAFARCRNPYRQRIDKGSKRLAEPREGTVRSLVHKRRKGVESVLREPLADEEVVAHDAAVKETALWTERRKNLAAAADKKIAKKKKDITYTKH
jgi:hypothetical protein